MIGANALRAARRIANGTCLGCKPLGDDLSNWMADLRDYNFAELALYDASAKYSPQPPPRIYQGSAGTCVLHSLTQAANVWELRRGLPHRQRSRRAGYALSRKLHNGFLWDGGTYHRTALEAWSKVGICLEEDYPYSTAFHKLNRMPPAHVLTKGLDAKELAYHWIDHPNPTERLRQVKAALRADCGVGYGMTLRTSFMDRSGPGIIDRMTGVVEGGHSMLLWGEYDDNEETLTTDQWWDGWRRHVPYVKWRYDTWLDHARDIFVVTLPEGRMAA